MQHALGGPPPSDTITGEGGSSSVMQRALDLGFGFEEFTTKLNCEGDMGGGDV